MEFFNQSLSQESQAPALERGIGLMELLQGGESLSLDELAQGLDSPKSSLLRILDTLQKKGWVSKDSKKNYRSTVKVVSLHEKMDWESHLEVKLSQLGEEVGLTVEWYEIQGERAVITWRFEPQAAYIRVLARIGYSRGVEEEIDAVAQVLLKGTSLIPGKKICHYDGGEKRPLLKKELKACLDGEEGLMGKDPEYNTNGVRRIATGLKDYKGKLRGIVALAEGFTPKADQLRSERLETLKKYTNELQQFLREMS